MTSSLTPELKPAEKAAILQEWELEARLTDVAIDEGMASRGEDGSNKVAVKSLLPEVKKAQQDLGAKPIPDEGAPTALHAVTAPSAGGADQIRIAGPRRGGASPGAHPSVFVPDYPP